MSIGSVIVTPTPTAAPLIAAITGFVHSKIRSVSSPPPSRVTGTPSISASLLLVTAATGERVAATGEVGAGAEPAPGTGDDHRTHVVVGVDRSNAVDHLAHHRAR